ncbi:MAG: ABC transporter substrate-binding protein [Pseudomonadota bacterium]
MLLAVTSLLAFLFGLASGLPRERDANLVRIVVPLLPPQVTIDGRGRETEIIRAAFAAQAPQVRVEFHVMPFTRHWQAYRDDERFTAVSTVPRDVELAGARSDVYVRYQNGIFFRRTEFPNGLGASPLQQLGQLRLVSFAGSTVVLPQLRPLSERARFYIERADQRAHSVMFADRFVDAVIADELIFDHYTREGIAQGAALDTNAIAFAPIFCPTPYQLVFRDFARRETFNRGLQKIKANGVLRRINRAYRQQRSIGRISQPPRGCPS